MDILDKARELGEMIRDSEEMRRYLDAEIDVEKDDKAKQLMNEFKALQVEVVRASKEGKNKEFIDGLREKLMDKQKVLDSNEVIKNFFKTKHNVDRLVKNVNEVIKYAITGDSGCYSGKCGSCSGCK